MNATGVATREVIAVYDRVYSRVGGVDRLADVFLPTEPRPAPVILFLHGGGWRFGDRRLAPDLKRHFAECGFAMVSADYRLSGEATFPAALEDVKTAIRWIRHSAPDFGFDGSRIGLWGSSAGGHLAALAALTPPTLFSGLEWASQSCDVAAVVDGYGPTDFLRMDEARDPEGKPSDDPESIQMPAGKLTADADSLESLFIGSPVTAAPDRAALANPVCYAHGDVCPFLIMHGASDTAVPAQQSELIYDALARHGADVELAIIDKLGHGFFNRSALDDAGPRQMTRRHSIGGMETRREAPDFVFGLARDFFRRRLRLD
jgi:acetyl esterase/lipase